MVLSQEYQKKIIDAIQSFEYFKRLNYNEEEIIQAKCLFLKEIESMIAEDKVSFVSAVLSFLNDTSEYLKNEEITIRLECAGIYGRRDFRIRIYEICYHFEILTFEATNALRNELIRLYQSNDSYKELDVYSYSNLISEIFEKTSISEEDKIMLKNTVSTEDVRTYEDLKIFLLLNSFNPQISHKRRLLDILAQIAVIQNTGLKHWSLNAGLTSINDVRKLLWKYGYSEAAAFFDDFINIITPVKKEKRALKDSELEEIDRISDAILSHLNIKAIDEISFKIAASFK